MVVQVIWEQDSLLLVPAKATLGVDWSEQSGKHMTLVKVAPSVALSPTR